ncbi:MAG: glutathione S-transferase N-terminal domain-containing protein [Maricaulis sp.]|uniref:glutathione S-transferase N-terminal domain-containing protein n=1 Tax=Maricaulis sp. TaxID=1486257 RepID=UPI001B157410|nr:glutathione S-transferase N-terminal domain-containing protein [Maricaulis sp.]MBO6730438.1 glutathione S-transferase N-terminal domain-containing protein [Maricaulis sp.]MBO6848636.1 glutathione S-transferase N-terminal domain-containing protein [Maricaulis sp.]MBO6878118.1 glutathione S-transferase N-terminal domain-containing protein [Maricaulis sp.]
MQLLVSHTSPYARKCRVLVRELGLQDKVEEIDAHPFEDGEILLRANPLGRVPCLIRDGKGYPESTLIGEILHEEAGYPWRYDWEDQRVEALASGLLDLAVGRRVEMVRDTAIYSDYWIGRREAGIARTLDVLESEAKRGLETDTMGALTIAIAVSYLDFRFPESDWRSGRAKLSALYEVWAARPSFQQTKPPADA